MKISLDRSSSWQRPLAAIVVLAFSSCGSSGGPAPFGPTWKPGYAQPVAAVGTRIAAVFITNSPTARRLGEDALAEELTAYGGFGVPSYMLLPDASPEREAARRALLQQGVDAVVSMRVVGHQQTTTYTRGFWAASPMHSSLWSYWGYGWGSVYAPDYLRTDSQVNIETLLYSLKEERLVWAGVSETFNAVEMEAAVRKIARTAVNEMSDENVLTR